MMMRDRISGQLDFIDNLVCVQCTYFHKTPEKNWFVSWHQDRAVSVASEVDAVEWSGWSRKEDMVFAHPPDHVLEQMLAVRLHLDDSNQNNGPLRVIAGTHDRGTLCDRDIGALTHNNRESLCLVRRGGVVVMRPLLLHASSKITEPNPRRVLHFLFAPADTSSEVKWRWGI